MKLEGVGVRVRLWVRADRVMIRGWSLSVQMLEVGLWVKLEGASVAMRLRLRLKWERGCGRR